MLGKNLQDKFGGKINGILDVLIRLNRVLSW